MAIRSLRQLAFTLGQSIEALQDLASRTDVYIREWTVPKKLPDGNPKMKDGVVQVREISESVGTGALLVMQFSRYRLLTATR